MTKTLKVLNNILFLVVFMVFISCDDPKPEIYTVTFDVNGGIGTPPVTMNTNEYGNITLPDKGNMSNKDKHFSGWNTTADCKGKWYSPGYYLHISSNITLFAQWEQFAVPTNLRLREINVLTWDAPEGYEDLTKYENVRDGHVYLYDECSCTRVAYLIFRRPANSSVAFTCYRNSTATMTSISGWEYGAGGSFEFFVALGMIKYSDIFHTESYISVLGAHSNVLSARIYSADEVLPAPTGLRAEVLSAYTAQLSWNPVYPTTIYTIYRSYNGYSWEEYGRKYYPGTEITVTQEAGSTAYWRVSAINGTLLIVGTPSDAIMVKTPGGWPDMVTGLNAVATSSNSINLSWNASDKATAYQIYCYTGSYISSYLVDTIIGTNYTHTGLIQNTDYNYYIIAINNEFNFIYEGSNSNSVSCTTPSSSDSVPPSMLILTNNTSSHVNSIQINNGNNVLSDNLNKNTSIQILLETGTYIITVIDIEERKMNFDITINSDTVRCSIVDSDWPTFNITLKNNYSYAIAGAYSRKVYANDWGTNLIKNAITTNNSELLGTFEQGPCEVMAESQEYYRVSTGTNDGGITISGGVLDGYKPVWYVAPSFMLNGDITVTAPATGWLGAKP